MDDANVRTDDDAARETEPVSQRPVVVAFTFCPAYVDGVKANAIPLGHDVRQSAERQSEVALNAVDDANGNCDAAAVDEAKNTPCVEIEDVVAEVVVPNVVFVVNGYPAAVFAIVHAFPAPYVTEMPVPLENVVVAAPIHAPFKNARVCPALPAKSDVVAKEVTLPAAPVRLPRM